MKLVSLRNIILEIVQLLMLIVTYKKEGKISKETLTPPFKYEEDCNLIGTH